MERETLYDHTARRLPEAAGFDTNAMSPDEFSEEMSTKVLETLKARETVSEFTETMIYDALEGNRAARYFLLDAAVSKVHEIVRSQVKGML